MFKEYLKTQDSEVVEETVHEDFRQSRRDRPRDNKHNSKGINKLQKSANPKHPEIQDKMKRPNLRIIGTEASEDSQFKGLVNIFNKAIEETFPNLKKRCQ